MLKRTTIYAILAFFLIVAVIQPIGIASRSETQQKERIKYNAQENKATVGSEGYVFSFVGRGDTPFYQFSDPTNRTYLVKFMKLMEFTDEDGDGKFDSKEANPWGKYSLPNEDWSFSVDNAEQTFTFSTPDNTNTPDISLVNHYVTEHPERLKFDIRISNWAWKDTSNMLALRFDVLSENDQEAPGYKLEDGVEFNKNAYFKSATTAKVDGIPTSVGISIEKQSVFLAYSHFTSLEHDPIIGFRAVSVIVPGGTPAVPPEEISTIVSGETSMKIPGVTSGITTIDYSYTVLVATSLLITVVYSRRR